MRVLSLGLLAALAAAVPVCAEASEPAVKPVESLDNGLISIMKAGKSAGVKGRISRLAPVVDSSFDLSLMTRLAVGSAWTRIPAPDQGALVAAFRRMTLAEYASNFDDYSGQSFAIAARVDARGGDRLVRTTLKDPHGDDVAIAYRLRQSGGDWKIIDVFYNNSISQIATRRSDFAAVLSKGGAKALIAHLNALAAKNGG